jgi:hypothetical protein
MEAEIVKITAERSCSARLPNDILLVFSEPEGHTLQIGHRLRFNNLGLDCLIQVFNQTQGVEFRVYIASNNVHDLRLPIQHGRSRTPTRERLNAPDVSPKNMGSLK